MASWFKLKILLLICSLISFSSLAREGARCSKIEDGQCFCGSLALEFESVSEASNYPDSVLHTACNSIILNNYTSQNLQTPASTTIEYGSEKIALNIVSLIKTDLEKSMPQKKSNKDDGGEKNKEGNSKSTDKSQKTDKAFGELDFSKLKYLDGKSPKDIPKESNEDNGGSSLGDNQLDDTSKQAIQDYRDKTITTGKGSVNEWDLKNVSKATKKQNRKVDKLNESEAFLYDEFKDKAAGMTDAEIKKKINEGDYEDVHANRVVKALRANDNVKKQEDHLQDNVRASKGLQTKELLQQDKSEALNSCVGEGCERAIELAGDEKVSNVLQEVGSMGEYDNQASKDRDPSYFYEKVGIELFNKENFASSKDHHKCQDVWAQISEGGASLLGDDNTKDLLDSSKDQAWIKSSRFDYMNTCPRYVSEDFLTNIKDSYNSQRQIKKDYICADTAKSITPQCSTVAKRYLSCRGISNRNIDKIMDKQNKDAFCEYTKSTYLKKELTEDFKYTPGLLLQNKEASLKKSMYEKFSEYMITMESGETKFDFNSFKRTNDTVSLCQLECEKTYGEAANVGLAEIVPEGGMEGCFAGVTAKDLSNTVEHCYAYKEMATINFKNDEIDESDREYTSFDGRYTCERTSPVTADYQFCKKLLVTYDAAFAAEQGMMMAEEVQKGLSQAKASGEFVAGQAAGNGQTAALDSMNTIAKTNEQIEAQKAALYTAQLGVFGGMMISWPTVNNAKKACIQGGVFHPQVCSNAVHFANKAGSAKDIFFPNYGVKQDFYAELIKAAGNAAVAFIRKNQYNKQQTMISDVKDQVEFPTDSGGFEFGPAYCEQYPNATQCRGRGTRSRVDGFQGGGLNLVGGGSQDYAISSEGLGEYNEGGREAPSTADLGDINSMLNDDVAKGSGDFNKVGAAKVTEGAPGGGGGGAGAGGASASLGGSSGGGEGEAAGKNDSFGVTRSGAQYASSGGAAGYTGSKAKQFGKDKKVDNPFSSLFGAKNNSRNVASQDENDIAPAQSSLFKKISSRYMKVKNDKRLLDSEVK